MEYSSTNGTALCVKCHADANYSNASGGDSAFYLGENGHALHRNRIGQDLKCVWCHSAVPHGYKNRSLLINLNGESIARQSNGVETWKYPYINGGFLRIASWPNPGSWSENNCGETNPPIGSPQTGRVWMESTCDPP